MSTEENKALNRRFWEEVFNQKNLAAIDDLCRADFVYHGASGPIRGSEAFKRFLQMYFSAFPDLHIHIEDQIAEGEKVVVRNTVTGTHQGALMSIAPTGKRVQISSIHVTRLVDGKSVEDWGNEDMLGLLQQLGVPYLARGWSTHIGTRAWRPTPLVWTSQSDVTIPSGRTAYQW